MGRDNGFFFRYRSRNPSIDLSLDDENPSNTT